MKKFYSIVGILFLLLSFQVSAQNCSTLVITSSTPGSVCGEGSVTLEATSSGTGDDIYWYDAATAGTYLGRGSVFQTPVISTTTSFWATEVIATGVTLTGQAKMSPTQAVPGGYTLTAGLAFTASQGFTLVDVEAYSYASGGTIASIQLQDNTGTMIQEVTNITVPAGGSGVNMVAFTIPLNFTIPSAGSYRLMVNGNTPSLARDSGATNAAFPHSIGTVGTVTEGILTASSATSYYYFYNWTVGTGSVTCESTTREEVIATVDNNADEDVLTLPYVHTANTATYGDNYSGGPGTDCGSTDAYLDGNDVVYKYTADDDYILTIELSGLSESYSGVFIYENCNDIGDLCSAEGSYNETAGTHSFQVAVEDMQDYFIVVSSKEPTISLDYTLSINGTTCANYPQPSGNATQNFIVGQTLADLDVTGTNLTWYSDAGTTTVIPDDTLLINNTTYYVTQSFQGCQGGALAVTVIEVACATLDIVSSSGSTVCGEGSVSLTAQGAEPIVNTEIFWYDAATGGDVVGKGSVFQTPTIDQTTSYWASEVALSGQILSGQAFANPTVTSTSTLTNYGLVFNLTDAITLIDVEVMSTTAAGGLINIELRDINNGNATVASATATIPGGGTTAAPIPYTVTLNFEIPAGNYRLLKTSGPGMSTATAANSNFPYNIGSSGQVTSGSFATGTTTTYYYFFNWTIFEGNVLCESSPREEVIATVNEVADEMVTEPLPFVHTANTSAYDNNYAGSPGSDCGGTGDFLNGNDVVYQFSPTVGAVYSVQLSGLSSNNASVFVYESCYDIGSGCYAGAVSDGTTGDFGIDEVAMYDGFDYFIVISTSESPTTAYTLTIDTAMINCVDYTAAPGGNEDQFFEDGDILDDLLVYGGNLIWYSDAAGTTTIPGTTLIVDGTTYYVGQTLNGCSSDLLEITVTEIVCDDLEIFSTTGATIVCKGTAVLEAVANGGPGTEIFWYDALVGGDRVGIGTTFTTPELSATTSFWATEVFIEGQAPMAGQGYIYPSTISSGSNNNQGVAFTITDEIDLIDVEIFSTGAGGPITIELIDINAGNTSIASATATVPAGGSAANPIPLTVPLNFNIPPGNYRLLKTSGTGPPMAYTLAGNTTYPYPIGLSGQITSGSTLTGTATTYYYFFNWTVGSGQVLCESPRMEATLTVSQDGDIVIPATLPYIDANNNTANYGNSFSGTPGTLCGTNENYLNGNDVVYMFTPTADDYIDITLSDLTDFYAGMFIYESCSDIYDDCIAGVVAGPSSNDISIEEFPVTAGETYYIVISSWLSSEIGYTLEITGFVCADFPAPLGDSSQDFAAGDTVADLEAEGTTPSSTLTWYSDAGGVNLIPDTTPLVNQTTYYVIQNFNGCDSPPLAVLASQIDCSNLNIVSTNGASVVCLGSMSLSANSSGSGNQIYWFDSASGGDVVGIGSTFETPVLTATTSYWAAEVYIDGGSGAGSGSVGPVNPAAVGTAGAGLVSTYEVIFDVLIQTTLVSVDIFPTATVGSTGSIDVRDSSNNLIVNVPYTTTVTGGSTPQTIPFNIVLPPGTGYKMVQANTVTLYRNTSGASYPYTSNAINITGNTFGAAYYYHFYNWQYGGGTVLCESPRAEVIATVTGDGDVVISSVPYTTTDNTSLYGNNFSGSPGSDCGTSGNYLDGNDVVYQYTPTADDIVKIELTGVGNQNAGLFVYESCGDIGTNCIAGTIRQSGLYEINEFYMTAGQSYYIVVSAQAGTTSYTLNIDGFVCADLDAPTGDSTQFYVGSNTLADVTVEENMHSTGLTWYTDSSGQNPVSDNTLLVDGTTYYVSQTVLGCQSPLFAVTVNEFPCNNLGIISTTGDLVCQSGSMTLTAQGSSIGNDIYWYDAQTGGNVVGIGSVFETPVLTNTTSYWAEEVFKDGLVVFPGQAETNPPALINTTSSNAGLLFAVTQPFTLVDVTVLNTAAAGGQIQVDIRDINNSNNVVFTTTVSMPGGGTTAAPVPVTIPINQYLPVGNYRILRVTSGSTVGLGYMSSANSSFPYTLGNNVGTVTSGSLLSSTSTLYYYFFNWTIEDGIVLCESPRVEAIAEVNTIIPNAPTGNAIQEFCDEGFTVADLDVIGSNIVWYNSNGNILSSGTVLQDGVKYYATQMINTCESNSLEVEISIISKSDIPLGNSNQTYLPGETLADLDITGQNLTWYSDPQGNNEIPATTPLQDVATYYVSQTMTDLCESELLAITVHRGSLDVVDVVFAEMQYYPNPVDGTLTITNSHAIDTIEVYSLLGQKVSHQKVGFNTTTVDMTDLASGPYLLKVTIDDKVGFYKLIKN